MRLSAIIAVVAALSGQVRAQASAQESSQERLTAIEAFADGLHAAIRDGDMDNASGSLGTFFDSGMARGVAAVDGMKPGRNNAGGLLTLRKQTPGPKQCHRFSDIPSPLDQRGNDAGLPIAGGGLLAAGGLLLAAVDYTKQKNYNPQKDPDVERGYQENQRENKQREDSKKDTGNYEVQRSASPPPGQGLDPKE
jgi:hypothetical protein